MTPPSRPARLSADIVARVGVVRSAAQPAAEHARWLESGHVMALGEGELGLEAAPASPAELGDSPAAISAALLRALFGRKPERAVVGVRTTRRPGVIAREVPWDEWAHAFAATESACGQPTDVA